MGSFFRSRPALSIESFERILLVKPSSLGDVVHALPVLHGLRTRYPRARIDWLIGSPFAPLIEGHREVDDLILFDRRRFGLIGRNLKVTGDFARFLRLLRERDYDLVIDLQGLFRTGFLSWATRARTRIGFRNAREGARMFYTHPIAVEEPNSHAVDRNYLVARLLGFADVPIQFNLPPADQVGVRALDMLRARGFTADDRLLAVVPGARSETKVWLPERFAETIDEVQTPGGARCVLLGGPDEVDLCARVAGACRSGPIDLAGQTSLQELAAVVARADVVLCHDSGVMHLAVAFGRPLVCLVGPTNPRRTGPYGRFDDVVRLDLNCSPCYLRRLAQCPHEHRCMRELTTPTVVSAVQRLLRRYSVPQA